MSFTANSEGGSYVHKIRTISNSYGLDAGPIGYSGKILFSDTASNLESHNIDLLNPYIVLNIWRRIS